MSLQTVASLSMIANKNYGCPIIENDEVFGPLPPKAQALQIGAGINVKIFDVPSSRGYYVNYVKTPWLGSNTIIKAFMIVFPYGIIFCKEKREKWKIIWFEHIKGPINAANQPPTFTILTKNKNYKFELDNYIDNGHKERGEIDDAQYTFDMRPPILIRGGRRKTKRSKRSNCTRRNKKCKRRTRRS